MVWFLIKRMGSLRSVRDSQIACSCIPMHAWLIVQRGTYMRMYMKWLYAPYSCCRQVAWEMVRHFKGLWITGKLARTTRESGRRANRFRQLLNNPDLVRVHRTVEEWRGSSCTRGCQLITSICLREALVGATVSLVTGQNSQPEPFGVLLIIKGLFIGYSYLYKEKLAFGLVLLTMFAKEFDHLYCGEIKTLIPLQTLHI